MKYETPEIEITRFALETAIMDMTNGDGADDGDGDNVDEFGTSLGSPDDLWGSF